ncbi:rhomboid family intramembrane serine protease [Neisseriaceae bacterium B1]
MNLNDLILTLLILITCITTYLGFTNQFVFQRYQFHVGSILRDKQYHRIITSGFLHADWMHLLFNMLTLYFFYKPIVYIYGVWLFLVLYFVAMAAGGLFSLWLYKNRPSYAAIGASGAVSGIIFAAIAINPLSSIFLFFIPIPIPAWLFATLYFAYSVWQMLHPKPWDNHGHAAHLGGAATGMLFAFVLTPQYIIHNATFVGIMSLPLLYLAYELLFNKKIR